MNTDNASKAFRQTRRGLLLLPLVFLSAQLWAAPVASPPAPDAQPATPESVLPAGACPLNSGGPSLLGSTWRLLSVYGNDVPEGLDITMRVGEADLTGFSGCNTYTAHFTRVGHTGFVVHGIDRTQLGCNVLATTPGGPTIHVGNWEGNYLRTLQRAGSVQQVGTTLQFYNRNGLPSVVFGKKYDGPAAEPAPRATP